MSASLTVAKNLADIPRGRAAMWWVITGEITVFGGFIVTYLMFRVRHSDFALEAHHTNVLLGAINTVILLTSGLFMSLATDAAMRGKGSKAAGLLWLTALMALAFLGVKAYEWSHEIELGLVPSKHLFWSFYYGMAGLHGLHIIAGIIAMASIAIPASKNRHLGRVEMVGMYWHLVDAIWIVLFTLIYVAR